MFNLLGSGADSQLKTDTTSFESSPFDVLLEEDSALMTEQMSVRTSRSGQTGQNAVLATPPLQGRGGCHNNNNVNFATPIQEEEVNQQNGFVATPPVIDEDQITDAAIKQSLDAGGEFSFEFNGDVYTLRLGEDGKYKAFDASNNIVDQEVRIQDNFTVSGFVEVGGLSGMNGGDRLYIGADPATGELAFVEASAELDANDDEIGGRTHLQTLLQTGKQHTPVVLNNNNNNGNLATPPPVQNNDLDQTGNFATPPPVQTAPEIPDESSDPEAPIDQAVTLSVFDQLLGAGWNDGSGVRDTGPSSFDLLMGEGWNSGSGNSNVGPTSIDLLMGYDSGE